MVELTSVIYRSHLKMAARKVGCRELDSGRVAATGHALHPRRRLFAAVFTFQTIIYCLAELLPRLCLLIFSEDCHFGSQLPDSILGLDDVTLLVLEGSILLPDVSRSPIETILKVASLDALLVFEHLLDITFHCFPPVLGGSIQSL